MVFRKFLKQWFGYTRGERAGSFILLIILLIILVVRAFNSGAPLTAEAGGMIEDASADSAAAVITGSDFSTGDSLYTFDPNTAAGDKLLGLGLSERQVRTIINYRNTGARFHEPGDFRKIYGIDREMQDRLLPFIIIGGDSRKEGPGGPGNLNDRRVEAGEKHIRDSVVEPDINHAGSAEKHSKVSVVNPGINHAGVAEKHITGSVVKPGINQAGVAEKNSRGSVVELDINHAGSADFEKLAGIGPVLAARIVKYRNLLGFFSDASQLSEVYGLGTDVIEMHCQGMTCDSLLIRKININLASYSDLLRHPYISRYQVEAISSYRQLSGSVRGMQELIVNRIFSPAEAERLKPYLEFE